MTISSDRYGPANFTVRLARLQRIPETLGVEALVLIAGQDGCENLGSARAVSYLLTGRSGRDVLETSSVDADFDDLVMVVRPDALAVYTSQRGYPRIANLALPHSRNLQLITPPSDLTDTDDLEAHKVGSFVQMLRGLKSLAMPVDPDSKDRRGVEAWPLVQAFGLDGVGRPGFFSMNFQVSDAFAALQAALLPLDATAALHLAHTEVRAFLESWEDQAALLSLSAPSDRQAPELLRAALPPRALEEPLTGAHAHGTQRLPPGVVESALPRPRVALGAHSNEPGDEVTDTTLGASGALHFVAESSDPRSGLYAARTYFLARGQYDWAALKKVGFDTSMYEDELEGEDAALPSSNPARIPRIGALLAAYQGLAEAAHRVVQPALTHTPAEAQVREQVLHFLTARLPALGLACAPDLLQHCLSLRLLSCTPGGDAVQLQLQPGHGSRSPWAVRLELKNVGFAPVEGCGRLFGREGPLPGTELLGAVVFGETFVAAPSPGGAEAGPRALALTGALPRLRCWSVPSDETTPEHLLHRHCTRILSAAAAPPPTTTTAILSFASLSGTGSLGRPINFGGDAISLRTGCPLLPAVQGLLHAYECGFILISRTLPPLVVTLAADVTQVRLVTCATAEHTKELLVLRCARPLLGLPLGPSLATPAREEHELSRLGFVALDLDSLSASGRKEFSRSVLAAWERECRVQSIPWTAHPEGIERGGDPSHEAAADFIAAAVTPEHERMAAVGRAGGDRTFPIPANDDDEVRTFMAAFDAEEIERCFAPPLALPALQPAPPEAVPLWVVLGLPAAGTALEDTVTALLRRPMSSEWVPAALPPLDSPSDISAVLDTALERIDASRASGSASLLSTPTVVLVAATLAPVDDVLHAIHASEPVRSGRAAVKCVTAVVDCRVAVESPGVFLPAALEHLLAPWTDHAVLLGDPDLTNGTARVILRARCPAAKVVQCEDYASLPRELDALFVSPDRRSPVTEAAALARLHRPRATLSSPRADTALSGRLQCLVLRFGGVVDTDALTRELGHAVEELQPSHGLPPLDDTPTGGLRLFAARAVVRPTRGGDQFVHASAVQRQEADDVISKVASRVEDLVLPCTTVHGGGGGAPPGALVPLAQGEAAWARALTWLAASGAEPGGVLLLMGTGLASKNFATVLERCAPWRPPALHQPRLKDLQSLTIVEKREIQKLCTDDPLPEGYVFDGFSYRDAFGDDLGEWHPLNFNSRAKVWIEERNKAIVAQNAAESAAHNRDHVRIL